MDEIQERLNKQNSGGTSKYDQDLQDRLKTVMEEDEPQLKKGTNNLSNSKLS